MKNSTEIDSISDPCHNFCLNKGVCSLTSLGIPFCHCKFPDFGGKRCEISNCHNFCLNNGHCRIGDESGTPECSCDSRFSGLRCETSLADDDVIEGDFYFTAFMVAIGANLALLLALISLCGLYVKKRRMKDAKERHSNGPDVVRKTNRTRTFSGKSRC